MPTGSNTIAMRYQEKAMFSPRTLKRRSFLKATVGGAAAGLAAGAFGGLGLSLAPVEAKAAELAISRAKLTTSICCYCAVGCGLLVWTDQKTKRSINIEGNPDHPINGGTLCPKGSSIWQLTEQSERVTEVLYRAPGASEWEKKSWDWALPRIAKKIQETRDASFEMTDAEGRFLHRTQAIASLGSAALDNEEGWMLQALMRSLGLVYIESHARI